MKEKGFTLIELLAVIVILAIIALIAVPYIINIISSSRTESIKRSAENYIELVGQTLMNQNLDADSSLELCDVKSDGNLKCYIGEEEIDVQVEFNGKAPQQGVIEAKSGTVIRVYNLELQGKYFNYKSSTVSTDGKKELKEGKEKLEEPICIAATTATKTTGKEPTGEYNIGDEYLCKVNETTRHHFFVLSKEAINGEEYINLIMNRNITETGEYSTVENSGTTYWNNTNNNTLNAYKNLKQGPTVAFDYLSQATSKWTNIPNVVIDYTNEQETYSAYKGIKTTKEETAIINSDGANQKTYSNLKARLPKYSEISSIGCTVTNILAGSSECPIYIVNYLEEATNEVEGKIVINGINGYWIMASDIFYYLAEASNPGQTSVVYKTLIPSITIEPSINFGIRPVITIKKEEMREV